MQKKLIAVAVAGALGVPAVALAQNSTVSVSGRMYVEYGYASVGSNATGTANRANPDILQTPGSNISFQGEEKLGGNLSAWFKCESTFDPRGMSQDGFCSRNSAVGFKGGFGNVFIGNWDTPFKRTRIMPGQNETGLWGTSALLTGHSTTASDGGSNAANGLSSQLFARRQNHMITYDSPNMSGFQVMAAVTAANAATNKTQSDPSSKTRVWSLAGQYDNGPLKIAAAYEKHNEFYAGGLDEDGWHIGASYTFGGSVTFGGMYTRQKWNLVAGTEGKVNAWTLGVDWKLGGPHSIKAAYTKAGDIKGNSAAGALRPASGPSTGAYMIQARYAYAFSKRTDINIGLNRVKNDTNAGYALNGFGPNGGVSAAHMGSKSTGYGIAIDHRF